MINAQRLACCWRTCWTWVASLPGCGHPHARRARPREIVTAIVELLPTGEHRLDLDLAPSPVEVDRPKVERIVHNLVGNAIRHTPAGTTIRISTAPRDGAALLVVEDDGPGIPTGDRARMFEPFVQGPRAQRGRQSRDRRRPQPRAPVRRAARWHGGADRERCGRGTVRRRAAAAMTQPGGSRTTSNQKSSIARTTRPSWSSPMGLVM